MSCTERKVFTLEMADEIENVKNAYKIMRTFWNTFNRTKREYERERQNAMEEGGADTRSISRSFRLQISIFERG